MILFGNQQNKGNDLIIQVAGKTSGTATAGTLVFSATEDISTKISATGSASFTIDIANDSIYKQHTVTLNCPNNQSGSLVIGSKSKIVSLGNHRGTSNPNVNFYAGTDATIPTITLNLNDLPQSVVKIMQLTSINSLLISGNKSLPTELTYLHLRGNNINWTYSGALPTELTYLHLRGNNINWTYSGALPTELIYLYLYGNNINWTYNQILGSKTFTTFTLQNYRISKMSNADAITFIDSLRTKTGNLPATCTLNDLENPTDAGVVAARDALLAAGKGVTTFNLGG